MLAKVLIGVLVVLAALLVFISTRPAEFRVERSTVIAAPAEEIHGRINDLREWRAWSPWAKLDPKARYTYEGPSAGVGAVSRWAGDHQVGEGSMTIIESRAPERVKFRLDFLKPFKATSTAEFVLAPVDGGTRLTWSMSGTNDLLGKAIGLVMDCDRMVGAQFEKGLTDLKMLCEERS
ncbi:MAG: hypothetical protein MOGMAGMI_01632 [Candidatus Omnitrophica bacterium]|nr:hypothetical protein [Candidatus Omnitrophota bacterium]